MKKTLLSLIALCIAFISYGQTAYLHTSNKLLYDFIDELANLHIIETNSAIKPYSRNDVALFLSQAYEKKEALSHARRGMLEHFIKEFAIELTDIRSFHERISSDSIKNSKIRWISPEFIWDDGFFKTLIRPIYGFRYFFNSNNDFLATYGGAEAISYIGNNWSVYISLRDNYQKGQKLSQPSYFTMEQGGTYKTLTGGGDGGEFSEMRGGITSSWNWGSFALVKDHLTWGDNLNGSNIFSGRTPSFPLIKLHLNPVHWLEFNYFHGWLVSEAVDSVNSIFSQTGQNRTILRRKYIAANMYTIKPFKNLHLSAGNSIVYGDMDVQIAYLIPFLFYKSVVHTMHWKSSYQNNAMFLNISSRQIKNLHLYASCYVDEFSITRINDPERNNFIGFKGGFSITDWPVKNLFFGGEYTRTNPITYKHDEPTTSFESNRYNLGHYLRDNSEEYFATLRFYPYKNIRLTGSYLYAWHGNEFEYIRGSTPPVDRLPAFQDKTWENTSFIFRTDYQAASNLFFFAEYLNADIKGYDVDGRSAQHYLNRFSPKYLHGKTNTISLGFNLGF